MYHGIILSGCDLHFPYKDGKKLIAARSFGAHKIASHMRKTGDWDIEVLDFLSAFSVDELKDFVDSRITKKTIFLGLSVFVNPTMPAGPFRSPVTEVVKRHNEISKYVKKKYPWVTIICGSQKLSNVLHHENVDWFCLGMGEIAMEAVCNYLIGKGPEPTNEVVKNPFKVEHIKFFREAEYRIVNATRHYPAWPLTRARNRFEERDYIQPTETLVVELSRGCKFKCSFCTYGPLGLKEDTTRDAEDYYDELLENYEKWGVTSYLYSDETVNDSTAKLEKFAEVTKRLPFTPNIHGFARADLFVTRGQKDWDLCLDMGFIGTGMGVETFNHRSGKAIKKGMNPQKLQDGLLEFKSYMQKNSPHGYYCGNLQTIAGLPFETFETLDATAAWANKYWDDDMLTIHPLYLFYYAGRNSYDAVSDFENRFEEWGYKWEAMDMTDVMMTWTGLEKYNQRNNSDTIDIKVLRESTSDDEYNNNLKYLAKHSDEELIRQGLSKWVHPSRDYDFTDMIQWTSDTQVKRQELKGGAFDMSNQWYLSWYTILKRELKEVFSGYGRPVDDDDYQHYLDLVDLYKEKKLRNI